METTVYFEAAQLLPAAEGKEQPMGFVDGGYVYGCCDAIWAAQHLNRKYASVMGTGYYGLADHVSRFCEVFKPEDTRGLCCYWFGDTSEDHKARVLALLFMHWMTIDEEKKHGR